MKNTDLIKAINDIDDEYIMEAVRKKPLFSFNRGTVLRYASAAAFVLVMSFVYISLADFYKKGMSDNMTAPSATDDQSIQIFNNNIEKVSDNKTDGQSYMLQEESISQVIEEDNDNVRTELYVSESGEGMYAVRKARLTDPPEAWNLPSCNEGHIYDYADRSVEILGNDGVAMYALWSNDTYSYIVSFIHEYSFEEALEITKGIE